MKHKWSLLCLVLILAACSAAPLPAPTAALPAPTQTALLATATLLPPTQTALPATPTLLPPTQTALPATSMPLLIPTLGSAGTTTLRVIILYDNTKTNAQLNSDWGFAALVEYRGRTILYDTGANGYILVQNMKKLGLDLESIEAIFFSHEHTDHTAGLQEVLDTGIRPTIYVPSAFPKAFKDQVRAQTRLVEIDNPLEIYPGVHAFRIEGSPTEAALVLETPDGSVVITGCAHPGVVQMVRYAQKIVNGKVALLAGGFHLLEMNTNQIQSIVTELQGLGVQKIVPTHCTGDLAITIFRTQFGAGYIEGGVGRSVTLAL